jgi:uncharacterized protein (DUF433 family)
MKWQERIVKEPKVLTGKPIIKGTRISVEFVLGLLARGWTTRRIVKEYDHLTAADIRACLLCARDALKKPTISVTDQPAFGMWKDREDMKDVAAYVRRLRRGRYAHLFKA